MASGIKTLICFVAVTLLRPASCRDEDRIMKACFWPYEVYEPCFGGCAEVSCDNPRNHLRPCYPYCEPGCVCQEPYVRDDRTHQCVLPQDCSPTQMGIPVPTRRSEKYNTNNNYNTKRHYAKKEEEVPEVRENEAVSISQSNPRTKFSSDVSRMGNYFNIVIAPPPIRALQPRKIMQSEAHRAPKRMLQ
ncbi:uncharacterized protein LOC134654335 [Cydia amplana]|uniref:uncharacterized protein LOC134654335 n=1 Tax=Cydia amplana TaxID=1869771 RepID=UPI002FE5C480